MNKDNTGGKDFLPDTCLPTMSFPSDHAIITARLSDISLGRLAGVPTPIQVAGVVAAAAFYIGKAYLEGRS